MAGNRGATSLKSRRGAAHPMFEYDALPEDLRQWVARGVLPWRAKSVSKAVERAVRRTGDRALALRELDQLQTKLVAKDAKRVWGPQHPECGRELCSAHQDEIDHI